MSGCLYFSLARMSTSTTGTGTITLGSAVSGWLSFADAGVADGDVVRYAIEDGTSREIGYGTYTSSGTTLTRNVEKSTNSDAAISLSGSAEVFITPSATDFGYISRRPAAHKWWRCIIKKNVLDTDYGGGLVTAVWKDMSDATITVGTWIEGNKYNGFPASNLGDGSSSTDWATSAAFYLIKPGCWFGIEQSSAVRVKSLALTAHSSSYANRLPVDLAIQYSDDGYDWRTAYTTSGLSWSLGETKTFTLPTDTYLS